MESDTTKNRRWGWIALFSAILLMIFLRCVALDSDAYPRLSWSSALLTDEGFYLHNARNRILFGHAQTDQFNNNLIMPLLDAVQTGVFHLFGVSAVSARAISVVLGLLTLPVFYDALRRAFGRRTAVLGLLLLGLDHVSLLYSRLALMDTPAAFVLVCAFWLWVKSGEGEASGRKRIWLALCGMVLGVCYAVRGLGALVYPAPMLLLAWEGWQGRGSEESGERPPGVGRYVGLACLLGGLVLALGIYGMLWYLPNRAELTRVNHYYLFEQLVPHSPSKLFINWGNALFGDQRGLFPFLVRHEAVQTCLVLIWLLRRASFAFRGQMQAPNDTNADFLMLWLLVFWGLLCSIDYSPSRYYVIFWPAFCGLAGLTLSDVSVFHNSLRNRTTAVVVGILAFHLSQSILHHLGLKGVIAPAIVGVAFLIFSWIWLKIRPRALQGETKPEPVRSATKLSMMSTANALPLTLLLAWAILNAYWMGDWLFHLSYRQRDADRWLAENLPANSVLYGAVAPGLTLNNRFLCVSVLEKLCNDQQPLDTYTSSPRYVLILDDQWREGFWQRQYPDVVSKERRVHAFRGLLRSFFVIGLYKVPDNFGRKP